MKTFNGWVLSLLFVMPFAFADDAIKVLGKDFTFPEKIEGLPTKLSEFKGLKINFFKTSDQVKLAYWEAGEGDPIVFIPGWSANGAEYFNVMFLLSQSYHVYVLDPRNQGLSEKVEFGNRISRYSADLNELLDHAKIKKAVFCGWSMGASVLWSYLDLYGSSRFEKAVFVDEPISIYAHSDWSEKETTNAGSITSTPEKTATAFVTPPKELSKDPNDLLVRYAAMDSLYYKNSETFARAVIKDDPNYLKTILFNHFVSDWRDVLKRVKVPTAIFTGEYSKNVPSQKWMQQAIPHSKLYIYSKEQQGDHFLMFKNPVQFVSDLKSFIGSKPRAASTAAPVEEKLSTELLKTDHAWNGKPYEKYSRGKPELSVMKFTIPPNTSLPWHQHPMPNGAYVISGKIILEDRKTGKTRVIHAGEAFGESRSGRNRVHVLGYFWATVIDSSGVENV